MQKISLLLNQRLSWQANISFYVTIVMREIIVQIKKLQQQLTIAFFYQIHSQQLCIQPLLDQALASSVRKIKTDRHLFKALGTIQCDLIGSVSGSLNRNINSSTKLFRSYLCQNHQLLLIMLIMRSFNLTCTEVGFLAGIILDLYILQ